ALLGLLAGAATPSGPAGLLYPLQVIGQFTGDGPDLQRTISELVPLLETRGSLATTLLVFKASIVWGVLWCVALWPRVSWLRIALWALGLVAAWNGQRNLGLYAVTFALLHTGPLLDRPTARGRLLGRWQGRVPAAAGRVAQVLGTAIGLTVIGFWLVAIVTDRFYLGEGVARRFGGGLTPATYPIAPAKDLAGRGVQRVANTVDAASTLIRLEAGRVSIDGRTEAYPATAWRTYADFRSGGTATRRLLDRWRADAVCVVHRNPASHAILRALIDDSAWRPIAVDAAGVALVRAPDGREENPGAWLVDRSAAITRRLREASGQGDVRLVDEAVAWAGLLQLYGQMPPARDLLERAVAIRGDHPVALHNLGNLLMAQGELESARRRFERAARLNRNAAPPLVNAGSCLFRLGRMREAVASFEQAVARDPRNFEGWANLAEARRQLGDREGAGAAYRRALSLRPGDRRLRERARTLGM
ncbi:tetratricopeptide repeat protein, partial [bacterium]|nr:tetratricopeptide repeat protein [bacterium]